VHQRHLAASCAANLLPSIRRSVWAVTLKETHVAIGFIIYHRREVTRARLKSRRTRQRPKMPNGRFADIPMFAVLPQARRTSVG
jgi:hypothetical protein